MRRYAFSEGCFSVSVRYLTTSRDGVFWYYRRIPIAARANLGLTANFVRVSLSTRDRSEAIRRVAEVNAKYEDEWKSVSPIARKAEHLTLWTLLNQQPVAQAAATSGPSSEVAAVVASPASLLLSEALGLYLSQHPKGANKRFRQNARLSIGYVIDAVGDLPLDRYTRQNALAVRDALLAKSKTTSVKRRFNVINAVFNAANHEHALTLNNPFSGIRIANLGSDTEKREEFTPDELKTLATACRQIADDRRYIIAIILDSGARLGEIVGLRVSDVFLDALVPYIHIRPFSGRSLKTTSSDRKVPLVGEALWAAKRAIEGKDLSGPLFPDYGPAKADSASNALNKWVREYLGIPKTMHGLRHTMRTRMRVAAIPEEIQNRIGGWTEGTSVSRGYGSYPLELLRKHLEKVVVD
ncbi:tyrosine-type recombinase/integrase [Methylocystis sp. H4A]|uniref:tyrosine-type recombinase/integrase n=1 Tax=Methylocystis sp. H4A TaxID=2785788 RepID=UPI0032B19BDD